MQYLSAVLRKLLLSLAPPPTTRLESNTLLLPAKFLDVFVAFSVVFFVRSLSSPSDMLKIDSISVCHAGDSVVCLVGDQSVQNGWIVVAFGVDDVVSVILFGGICDGMENVGRVVGRVVESKLIGFCPRRVIWLMIWNYLLISAIYLRHRFDYQSR